MLKFLSTDDDTDYVGMTMVLPTFMSQRTKKWVKLQGQGHYVNMVKLWYDVNGLATREAQMKYESSICHCSKSYGQG